jgi:phosphoserine phosphatase
MLAPAISKTNLKSYDVPLDDLRSASAALAEIAASPAGPEMGAFFDLDGTLVDDAGLLTGNIVRPIVWGPTKAAAVQNFCTDNAVLLDDSYFYADGGEDAALMAQVGHPRPVNPRPRLAAEAGERGWPVLRVTGSGSRPRVRSMLRNGA